MKKLILVLILVSSTLGMKSENKIDINKYQICFNKVEKINITKKLKAKQIKRNNYPKTENFENNIAKIKKFCKLYNIPWEAIAWLWYRESNFGQSYGAKKDNIHFGVKCHGKKGVMYYDDCKGKCCFVSYSSFEESLKDLMMFLKKNPRYEKAGLFNAKTAEEAVKALSAAKYATDVKFVNNFYKEYQKLNISGL